MTARNSLWGRVGLLVLLTAVPPCLVAQKAGTAKTPLQYADPLVGTAPLDDQKLIGNAPPPGEQIYSGFVSPAARLPHGSTELGPINANLDVDFLAGVPALYYYPNRVMFGFTTGAHQSPTLTPVVGDWTMPPQRPASVYDKAKEKASAGYYSVYLDDYQTEVEMTATDWAGIFRLTFPKTAKANVLLDLGRGGGDVEIVDSTTVRGKSANGRTFFIAKFSKPFEAYGTFKQIPPTSSGEPLIGDDDVMPGSKNISGHFAGSYVRYATTEGEQVLVKVASGPSFAAAEQRLQSEIADWDFDRVHHQAEQVWAPKLGAIEVKGGTEKERMLFYSCLYNSFYSPHLLARKGEQFTGHNGAVETAAYDRYGEVPLWDTGRNQIVLLTLLEPETKHDILQSELDDARERGYMETSFHGDNAVFMYLGDWERGLKFDYPSVYEYLRRNATDPAGPRPYLAEYVKQGWIADFIPKGNPSPPYAGGKAGAATTLEYAWDDYAMALFAEKLGKTDDAKMFLGRAQNYKNVFDPSVGFVRGKTADGHWISPFDPGEPYYNFMMKEASGWSTLWLTPFDVRGLADELGGRAKFAAKLDRFFTTPYTAKGICRDCTGMVGEYVQGNQPDQQAAYYYDWAGQPWKTQQLTRRILHEMYGSDRYGLGFPGMDDQGSTSSWYVMSALGFYPVDPSSPNYILGSPLFNEATIHMGGGHDFTIVALHNSERNMYIQSATLNGKVWNKPWFSHADIVNGGKLVLTMGPEANRVWGSAPDDAPPSMTKALE